LVVCQTKRFQAAKLTFQEGDDLPRHLLLPLSGLVRCISLKISLTQESRPGRISAGRHGQMLDLDCSDWSNGLRFDTKHSIPDPTLSLSRPLSKPAPNLDLMFAYGHLKHEI
jgi:hypothetical protein